MGELDFVIAYRGGVLPIEVKSGKDYERHNALGNVLECEEYNIKEGLVLCKDNMKTKGKVIYAPIYMAMFLRPASDDIGIYRIDLSSLHYR